MSTAMALAQRLQQVRHHSLELIAPLESEDLCLQGMADASPPKWHLGHTTWFFETFVLKPALAKGQITGFEPAPEAWSYLFNSYYDAVGARHPRPERGLLSRPAIGAVLAWRQRVDAALQQLLSRSDANDLSAEQLNLLELGLQHEQQHQELLLMDLLDGFSRNPLEPIYDAAPEARFAAAWRQQRAGSGHDPCWLSHPGGLVELGHPGAADDIPGDGLVAEDFHFDNEAPRHRVWLEPFAIAERLVSNGDFAAFIADGGYRRPELWMSEGWATVQQRGWEAPRYWRGSDAFTLAGRQQRDAAAPVRHLSWFEADAYARWAGARLPSEAEWELLADQLPQAFGVVWQWTASPYRPYPGFAPAAGAVGEYNGKFMSSQMVLRGSCHLTPHGHERRTYRNFFGPSCRWMVSGVRLARDSQQQASP